MTADKWEIYQEINGPWRWRRTAGIGRIVGASRQGYSRRIDCLANARRAGYTGS